MALLSPTPVLVEEVPGRVRLGSSRAEAAPLPQRGPFRNTDTTVPLHLSPLVRGFPGLCPQLHWSMGSALSMGTAVPPWKAPVFPQGTSDLPNTASGRNARDEPFQEPALQSDVGCGTYSMESMEF